MPQLTFRTGLCPQPVTSLSPIGILRDPVQGQLSIVAAQDVDSQFAACPTVLPLETPDHLVCECIANDSCDYNDTVSEAGTEDGDGALSTTLRLPVWLPIWQISDVQHRLILGRGGDKTVGLITRKDAWESRPWSFLNLTCLDDKNARESIEVHDTNCRLEYHSCETQHDTAMCDGCEAAHLSETPDPEEAAGKRIASFQSSSDASTRRSSIWDDDYGGEVEEDNASEVTDVSDLDDRKCRNDKDALAASQHDIETSSQLGYSDHELHTPNPRHSNITVLRSLRRRRSSPSALLLLQAKVSHLQAKQARIQEDKTHLQKINDQLSMEKAHLLSQNTSLSAALTATTQSLATARDNISTQSTQIKSLRRRVSFLERWVDSLHDEKLALHEENTALKVVGSARAEAVIQLRESYERLEVVVEKAVGASEKRHDCLLEVELEGLRGRLGGLRIVS